MNCEGRKQKKEKREQTWLSCQTNEKGSYTCDDSVNQWFKRSRQCRWCGRKQLFERRQRWQFLYLCVLLDISRFRDALCSYHFFYIIIRKQPLCYFKMHKDRRTNVVLVETQGHRINDDSAIGRDPIAPASAATPAVTATSSLTSTNGTTITFIGAKASVVPQPPSDPTGPASFFNGGLVPPRHFKTRSERRKGNEDGNSCLRVCVCLCYWMSLSFEIYCFLTSFLIFIFIQKRFNREFRWLSRPPCCSPRINLGRSKHFSCST